MKTKYNKPKTLGPRSAQLYVQLEEERRQIFTLDDVERITRLKPASSRNLVCKLVNRGVVYRLKHGLFTLVPYELGKATEYMGNRFIVAHELVRPAPYYIAFATALEIHQMTTQPQATVYVACPVMKKPLSIFNTPFQFVYTPPALFWGIEEHWVEKHEKVSVSDRERTILDALRLPQYVGGVTEAASALKMRQKEIDVEKLIRYALKLNKGAVIRRLGYLLELCGVASQNQLKLLEERLTEAYIVLDPLLPRDGRHIRRWRLLVNINPKELEELGRT